MSQPRGGGSSGVLPYHVHKVGEWHGAALSPQHLALSEEHKRGHSHNAILLCHRAGAVYVEFYDAHAVAGLGFELLEHGVHGLSRAAPCGIEVYKRETLAAYYIKEIFHNDYL